MKPFLFSSQGIAALNRLLSAPTLMAFDFDGTLAPIGADPADARIRPSWRAHLQQIQRRWPLAVISGRQLADLVPRLGFEPAFLAGNHGAESVATEATNTISTCLDSARRVLAAQTGAIDALGMEVEDKGLSLAVHYRRSNRAADAVAFATRLLATLPPVLAVSHGKAVFNITVCAAPDKGDALLHAMRFFGVEHALYVGDDVNDEPAFAAASPHSVTVRIGARRSPTNARFRLAAHPQLGLLLRTLATRR